MTQTEIPESLRWEREQHRAVAERAHDMEEEFKLRSNDAAINNANFALRTLVVINGGAAIAILAFIGSLASIAADAVSRGLPKLTGPLVFFAWGVALAAFGVMLAYLTNYCIATMSAYRSRHYEHPFLRDTKRSNRWYRAAIFFQVVAMIVALGSLAVFLIGMYEIREAVVTSVQFHSSSY